MRTSSTVVRSIRSASGGLPKRPVEKSPGILGWRKRAFKKLHNYILFSLLLSFFLFVYEIYYLRIDISSKTKASASEGDRLPSKGSFERGMKMVVAILLASSVRTGAVRLLPETIANVSMLLAGHHDVDCVQIFRTEDLPATKVEEIHRMWKVLAVTESRITTGVYTYEGYLRKKKHRPRKVSCYRSLKIMWDDEESKKGYAKFSMQFTLKDAVWVLYTESFSVKFFQDARVVFDDVLIVAEMKSEELILFHEVYRVRNDHPLKVLFLGNWTRGQGLRISEEAMYDRRWDLEGVVLKTGSVSNWPASYLKDGTWQGFLIKLWNEVRSLVNCTSVTVEGADLVGMRMKNGSWNGLVGMALRGEIDVIVTEVVIDKERSHALKFFYPIMKSRFQIYTRHLGYRWQWASILRPFHVDVWAAAFAWIFVATFFWTFIHRACSCSGLGSMDFGKVPSLCSFFFVMQTLCQQGYHHTPASHACRVFFFVSYAVSGVLIPSYSASLVSSLAQKIHLRSFDSLEDMVADGSYRLMVKENTAQHAFFAHSKQEFFKLAYEKLVKPVPEEMKKWGLTQSMKALCHLDKYAVMGIEDVIESRLHHLATIDCPVVHLSHPVSTVYLTMATAKDNPYWGVINHHLGKLLNTGVAERLKRTEFPPGSDTDLHTQDSEVEVGMRQVVSAFLFIGLSTAFSVFLLLLEMRYLGRRNIKDGQYKKKRTLRWGQPQGTAGFEVKARRYLRSKTRVTSFPDGPSFRF